MLMETGEEESKKLLRKHSRNVYLENLQILQIVESGSRMTVMVDIIST